MKILRMLVFAALGALVSAIGGSWGKARRHPVVWPKIVLDSIEGGAMPTGDYAGRVVLLVNTASQCGFTKQYRGLEALWLCYKNKGLVVLGVPSNDFGRQEPGSNGEIKDFCEANFDVTFPLAGKQIVCGRTAHPLYRWAAAQTGALGTPGWNFHKILIGRDGCVVDWFSAVAGTGPKLDRAVQAALISARQRP